MKRGWGNEALFSTWIHGWCFCGLEGGGGLLGFLVVWALGDALWFGFGFGAWVCMRGGGEGKGRVECSITGIYILQCYACPGEVSRVPVWYWGLRWRGVRRREVMSACSPRNGHAGFEVVDTRTCPGLYPRDSLPPCRIEVPGPRDAVN